MIKSKKKLIKEKKKLIYIIVSIALFFAIVNGSIFIYQSISISKKNHTIATSNKPAADKLMTKAVEALNTNRTQAKALFQAARRQYEYVIENTTDIAIHDDAQEGIVNCNAQLWLIEHS